MQTRFQLTLQFKYRKQKREQQTSSLPLSIIIIDGITKIKAMVKRWKVRYLPINHNIYCWYRFLSFDNNYKITILFLDTKQFSPCLSTCSDFGSFDITSFHLVLMYLSMPSKKQTTLDSNVPDWWDHSHKSKNRLLFA